MILLTIMQWTANQNSFCFIEFHYLKLKKKKRKENILCIYADGKKSYLYRVISYYILLLYRITFVLWCEWTLNTGKPNQMVILSKVFEY